MEKADPRMQNDAVQPRSDMNRQALRSDHVILLFLLACNLSLVIAYLLPWAMFGRIFFVFALDREANIPVWWSSAQLLLAGLFLGLVALRTRTVEPYSWALGILAGILVFMSAEETIGLHERLGAYVARRLTGDLNAPAIETGVWIVVIGGPVILGMLALLNRLGAFLGSVPGTRRHLVYGFLVLLVGSTAMEVFELFSPITTQQAFLFRHALEEFLEMTGGSILLWASLLFAREHWSTQAVRTLFYPSSLSEKRAYDRIRAFQESGQDPDPAATPVVSHR